MNGNALSYGFDAEPLPELSELGVQRGDLGIGRTNQRRVERVTRPSLYPCFNNRWRH